MPSATGVTVWRVSEVWKWLRKVSSMPFVPERVADEILVACCICPLILADMRQNKVTFFVVPDKEERPSPLVPLVGGPYRGRYTSGKYGELQPAGTSKTDKSHSARSKAPCNG